VNHRAAITPRTRLRSSTGAAVLRAATLPVDDAYAQARQDFWARRLDALYPVVTRGIERGDLRAHSDAKLLLLEMLVAPLHARLLVIGERIDDDLAERLVDLALNGAAAPPTKQVTRPGDSSAPAG
jgi:tetracycline repressor-like protein